MFTLAESFKQIHYHIFIILSEYIKESIVYIRGCAVFMGIRGWAGEILVTKKKSLPRCFSEQKKSLPRCFSIQKKSLPRCPPARPRFPINFAHPLIVFSATLGNIFEKKIKKSYKITPHNPSFLI